MYYNQARLSFLRRMLQIRRNFLTTCTQKSIQEAKSQAYVTFSGRSMVEMLGVLAIIGVLSVGAISGYSRVMMKYKLNKQTEQISTILNNMLFESARIPSSDKSQLTKDILIKLGAIPENMVDKKTNTIYDVFNNKIVTPNCNNTYCSLQVVFTTSEQCMNLINLGKEYSDKLYYLQIWSNNQAYTIDRLYGDSDCGKGWVSLCLKNVSIPDLSSYCSSVDLHDQFSYSVNYTFYGKLMP